MVHGNPLPSNDLVLLNALLEQTLPQFPGDLDEAERFEYFVFEQILKPYDLSESEIRYGQMSGGDDGGIDGLYTLVDSVLIREDTDLSAFRAAGTVDLYVIQAKREGSFKEEPIDKVQKTVRDLFALAGPEDSQKIRYNSDLLTAAGIFRDCCKKLAADFPNIRLTVVYATKGETNEAHPKVMAAAVALRTQMGTMYTDAEVEVRLLGARELYEEAKKKRRSRLRLVFQKLFTKGEDGYVALSTINDFHAFITDDRGSMRKDVFDSNVRDFQGNVEVNKDISGTLAARDDVDFWWLNNGITIVCTRARLQGDIILMEDAQIVNGLQTTVSIHRYMKREKPQNDKRSILIKILQTRESRTRDRVIKATNFQTAVTAGSLRATDPFQAKLEDFFVSHGMYYDRRKNYHKNLGRAASQIISIEYLGQALMAIALRQPDQARARPTTLIKDDNGYRKVFDPNRRLEVYLFCAKTMRAVEELGREKIDGMQIELKDETRFKVRNYRFHLGLFCTAGFVGRLDFTESALDSVADKEVDAGVFGRAFDYLDFLRSRHADSYDFDWDEDRMAKSNLFVQYALDPQADEDSSEPVDHVFARVFGLDSP